ncbi:MAG: hypothetical protein HOI53_04030 [Francisellaceae bacterium]|jgi:hypothetical protein|nr:hypothetical protein [Francisellaceae bacterium]MBT6207172.1 hypothetical protein [Francisellaceae bacterium]MBT6538750.1 hypothetical protein [Francisellaceae bacterium]
MEKSSNDELDIPELVLLFSDLDLQTMYSSYVAENFSGINKLKLLSSKHKKEREIRRMQVDFVYKVQVLANDSSLINRAYLLLGALQFVQGRWTPFPTTGILYELVLKASDLEQMISENAKVIDLEKLFQCPSLIRDMADESLRRLISSNPELLA